MEKIPKNGLEPNSICLIPLEIVDQCSDIDSRINEVNQSFLMHCMGCLASLKVQQNANYFWLRDHFTGIGFFATGAIAFARNFFSAYSLYIENCNLHDKFNELCVKPLQVFKECREQQNPNKI